MVFPLSGKCDINSGSLKLGGMKFKVSSQNNIKKRLGCDLEGMGGIESHFVSVVHPILYAFLVA
jgi:hypothetical protein